MKKVLSILLVLILGLGLFTGCGNELSDEMQVTTSAYMQIPNEWVNNTNEVFGTDGVTFQTSEDSNVYQYLSISEYQGDFETYMSAWLNTFSKEEDFQIINQEDILAGGCNAKMTEFSLTSNGKLFYHKYYTIQKDSNVICIAYMSDSNDYELLDKALETFHF